MRDAGRYERIRIAPEGKIVTHGGRPLEVGRGKLDAFLGARDRSLLGSEFSDLGIVDRPVEEDT